MSAAPGRRGCFLAGRTAAGGLSTAIVEDRPVGDECGFYGCMPLATVTRPYRERVRCSGRGRNLPRSTSRALSLPARLGASSDRRSGRSHRTVRVETP